MAPSCSMDDEWVTVEWDKPAQRNFLSLVFSSHLASPPALWPSPYPLIFRTSPYLIHQPAWLPSTTLMGSHAFGQLSMRLVSSMGRSPPAPKKNAKKRKQITLPRALTKKGSTPSNSKMPPSFHQTIHKL